MAVAHHLLAVVVLCAAFASADAFTDPSDGTFARTQSVAIELLITPRNVSTLCARMRARVLGVVASMSVRVIVVACACVRAIVLDLARICGQL